MDGNRVERAAERTRAAAGGRPDATSTALRRAVAIGDPQTSLNRFLRVLDRHGLLGDDGWLAEDRGLVSLGDHFDYRAQDGSDPAVDGIAILRWLAAHPPDQVVILLGNHDAARVMELITLSDPRFARARALGEELQSLVGRDPAAYERRLVDFCRDFPDVPTPGLAARDYNSYSEAQRGLVASLLLEERFRLATSARLLDGRPVLVTHAGCTTRELDLLGLPSSAPPAAIAAALNGRLDRAIAAVRPAWLSGEAIPLDLSPLHVAGAQPEEAGGLLSHRPANPHRAGADTAWERRPDRPRRFDPRELPPGLLQVCGHTGHAKCRAELVPWVSPAAGVRPRGGIRTLRVAGETVVYDLGIAPPMPGATDLYLVDAEMNHEDPESVPVLELDASQAP